jgi:hypothetical protein
VGIGLCLTGLKIMRSEDHAVGEMMPYFGHSMIKASSPGKGLAVYDISGLGLASITA